MDIPLQTILIKEDGQWKVDAAQTLISVFDGAMAEVMKGLGKALEEGFKKGFEDMGKTITEGIQRMFTSSEKAKRSEMP